MPSEGLGAAYTWNALPRRSLGVTSVYISVIFRVLCYFSNINILSYARLRRCLGVPQEGLGAPYAWNALLWRGLGLTSVYISVIFRVLDCPFSKIVFYPMRGLGAA